MQKQVLDVEKRLLSGKGHARRLRSEGSIPAVLYGLGSSTPVTVNRKELARILNAGASALLSIRFKDSKAEKLAIVRDFQTDPVKNVLTHADFLEVAADKPIQVTVSLVLSDADIKGVKEGGIPQQPLRSVQVECLPMDIPESIVVDASGLGIGENIHLADVTFPGGVKPVTELDQLVVSIAAPVSEAQLEEMLAGEGEAEVAEPELVSEEKKEEKEEGGE